MAAKIPTKTKILYGVGAFGYGSTGQAFSAFLMFFGTGILGIPGTLMGVAIAISTIWDGGTDPIVGYMSDRMKSRRFGKRHLFILVGCVAVAIVNIMIWSISPDLPLGAKFALLLFLLLVIETFNTTFSTPYQALGLDLAQNYEDRTAIQAFKTVFSFSSLLVPSLLMAVFLSPDRYANVGESSRGYIHIAMVTSALCIICGLTVFFGTYKHRHINTRQEETEEKKTSIFNDFFGVIRQKNVGRLILGYAISLSAGAFITSLGLHIFTFTFMFTTYQIPIIMMCMVIGIVFGQPMWFYIARRTDKIKALLAALCLVLVGMVVFSLVLATRNTVRAEAVLPLVAMTIFICGLGTGCMYSIPMSMFADCIDIERRKTGNDKTATSAAFLTFCMKISNAFIMFVIGLSLDIIGFDGGRATQSMNVQNWLGMLLIIGVTIACVSAFIVYSGYTYRKKDFQSDNEVD